MDEKDNQMNEAAKAHGNGDVESVPDLLAKFGLTDAEVGRLLGVPAKTIANLHRTGALRACKVGGRCVWRPKDVKAFVEALEQDA